MKSTLLPTLLLLCLFSVKIPAQPVKDYQIILKNGTFTPEKNVKQGNKDGFGLRLNPDKGKNLVVIQFEEIPSAAERERLKSEGIELLDYIPNNAYTATIASTFTNASLTRSKARAVFSLTANQKMPISLGNGTIPSHAEKVKGMVDLWINFPRSFTLTEVRDALQNDGFEILSENQSAYQILEIRAKKSRLNELAMKNYIQYLEPVPKADKSFNNNSTANGRANVLGSSLNAGRNLHGEGVVVGVGDNANPLQHIDFANRIINRMEIDSGRHGIHVMGTLAGAGIVNEKYAGYAPKATILSQYYSKIFNYAPAYVQDYGMVITNNSYGNDLTDCSTFGSYDLQSQILDQQAFQLPYLQHVFAAGNSGTSVCSPFPAGFGNVIGGYQAAKNVISVGNTTVQGIVDPSSSRGPVRDGRIKPEITAQGTLVMSSIPQDSYVLSTGTSMASPAVSGGLALLYQRYRQLHSGQNPKNGLMKAILINGGIDQGNAGPDYKYGFGWMNLLRSVKMLETESYRIASTATSSVPNSFSIEVPANTAQLKVMLYWNDPAASAAAAKTLVNDLDLSVATPGNGTVLPKILDATPGNVNNESTTGADHINNIEQVVIDMPANGSYSINVLGTAVNQNPTQEYFVVYDIIPVSTTITNPIGSEHYVGNDDVYIAWDSFGNPSTDFTVQYQTDENAAWNTITGTLTAKARQLKWTIPDISTGSARVKVIQNATGIQTISEPFTILGRPLLSLSAVQCEGYIAMDWTAVSGATDYEVMLLAGGEMISKGVTTNLHFELGGLSKDSTYWFSVRPRINSKPGMRAVALSRKPDSGSCTGTISDHDLKLETIVTPVSSGRLLTPTALTNQTDLTIRIKNLDDQPFSGPVSLGYSINGNSATTVSTSLEIAPQSTIDYTFAAKADMAVAGSHAVQAFVTAAGDLMTGNNTLAKTYAQLTNSAIALPFLDNIEAAAVQETVVTKRGLQAADRYDFTNSSTAGRIRTFVNSGMSYSGSKALTLDTDRFYPNGNTNFLDATFNLAVYNLSQDIRLNFRYKNHGQKNHPDNKVWVRGSYNDPWIQVYDLFANQNTINQGYKLSSSIEISNTLFDNNQNLTTSTQIRWGQHGNILTADPTSGAGYSFDDIQISIVNDDIQLLALTEISESSCGLGSQQPITILIRNSSDHAINNIPVHYQLNGGTVINEIIPSINARTTITFSFSTKQDLSAIGSSHLKVWSSLASDTYAENNTIELDVYNNQQISEFPYLQNFETGTGNWHSAGTSNSWAYGTPASNKINKAASGSKIWKTNLAGNYSNNELSYLYSPCFNLAGMTSPTLSFSVALDIEFCSGEDCDVAFLEYSTDGKIWNRLGSKGQGTNWYNKITDDSQGWSVQDYTRWHVGTIPLPVTNGNVRLRFVMKADPGTVKEGIAIDDIHVYDNLNGIYTGETTTTAVTQNTPNSAGWINFTQNGQLVASINPNGQTLGATTVKAYHNTGNVRNTQTQYYMDRNITIIPATSAFSSDVSVRLYFPDSESEKLIGATTCAGCAKPASAYDLGITKYSDAAHRENEDGVLTNNTTGIWSYLATTDIVKVPFDKGYYAQFSLKTFSEFWFNTGGSLQNGALPVDLLSFTVASEISADDSEEVIANWITTSELNTERFELERAVGADEVKRNQFVKIGTVSASGNSSSQEHYSFRDLHPDISAVNYYRLKMIDRDESFAYSRIQFVSFDQKKGWRAFPNPSRDFVNVFFQADAGSNVTLKTFDLKGNLLYQSNIVASGVEEKHVIDITGANFPAGLYLIELTSRQQKKSFRLMKL